MNTKFVKRFLTLAMTVTVAATSVLPMSALAAEYDPDPDLPALAAQVMDPDAPAPDLSVLSPEDYDALVALVGAIRAGTYVTASETTPVETVAAVAEPEPERAAVASFSDVPYGHVFYEGIMSCASKGIVAGYADGTYKPGATVTRAQFCVMLSRAFYNAQAEALSTDANKAKGWFVPNSMALKNAGMLSGTSFESGYDKPSVMNVVISRYDMAQLMTNIMAAKGFKAKTVDKTAAQKKIADYTSIPVTYRDAVKNVFALGIITGYSNGTFGGTGNMTRGAGATVIYRMMKYTPAGSSNPDEYDDGKNKPTTGTGNTGSTSGGNTGATSGSTGSTSTESKEPTLANGKPVTQANVIAMLNELQNKYPEGTNFANGYAKGISSKTKTAIHNYICSIGNAKNTSTTHGCGGYAAMISDAIFGDLPIRKVSNSQARPGDVIIILNKDGKLSHVAIVLRWATKDDNSVKYSYLADEPGAKPVLVTDASTRNDVYFTYWEDRAHNTVPDFTGETVEIWTRYPA